MDRRLFATLLPGIWVIETVARSNKIDVSLLLDLLEKFQQTSEDLGKNARELVSLRILESFLSQGAQPDSLISSSPKIAPDQSESFEDVLQRILLETHASNLNGAGPEMWKWDVQSFIAVKRSTLDKHALQQHLKDAILKGGHSFISSFKEQSGLPFGNPPESGFVVYGGKPDGIMHRYEKTNSYPRISENNRQLIHPAVKNSSYLMHSDRPNENLSPVKQKRCCTSKISSGTSCKDHIISEDGFEAHSELSNMYENDTIHCEQDLGGRFSSSIVNSHSVDTSVMIGQYSKVESVLERSTNFEGTRTYGPTEVDNNECTSLKDIGGDDAENKDPHCDREVPNYKYGDGHVQEIETREAKGDKEGLCGLRSSKEEGIPIGCGQSTNSRYCLATDRSNLNMLADVCARVDKVSQVLGYVLVNKTCTRSMEQKGPPGDIEFTSSSHEKEMHHKEQICNHNSEHDLEDGNASECAGFLEQKTSNECKDGFEREIHRNVREGDVEHVVSVDSDGCLDERIDTETKRNALLSSRYSFNEGSVDCRELKVCVKCNESGDLKVCSTNSCHLVVHVSCLNSHMSFSTRGKFLCPFCAYSQAILEYMDIKKKVSLTRADFATFVCFGARKEMKKRPCGSYRSNQHHIKQNDGLYRSIEPNNQYNNKHINNQKRRRKLEFQDASCSTLSSGDDSPSRGETVDETNGEAHLLDKHKREMKQMRPMPQATGAHGQSVMVAAAILSSKSEKTSDKDSRIASMRVQKHKRQNTHSDIPHLRLKKVFWIAAEEEILKEEMRKFSTPEKGIIPWKKILNYGANVFLDGRTTMELKDKWRNLCRASPKL